MNYYEHHLGDYMRDAGHLSMTEDGAYRRLLDSYYAREAPLPLDVKQCQKLARCASAADRKAVVYVLTNFFEQHDDGYRQKRCDEEIAKARARIQAARSNGQKGGRPKAEANPEQTHEEPTGLLVGSNPLTQTKALQSPDSNLHTPRKREDRAQALADARAVQGVNLTAFDRWIGYRNERKPAIKTISLVACAQQLAKLGTDEQQELAVQNSIANGYQGLVPPKVNGSHQASARDKLTWRPNEDEDRVPE